MVCTVVELFLLCCFCLLERWMLFENLHGLNIICGEKGKLLLKCFLCMFEKGLKKKIFVKMFLLSDDTKTRFIVLIFFGMVFNMQFYENCIAFYLLLVYILNLFRQNYFAEKFY